MGRWGKQEIRARNPLGAVELKKMDGMYVKDGVLWQTHFPNDEMVVDFNPLEEKSDLELKKIADIVACMEQRRVDFGILYYKPYESRLVPGTYPQDLFHRSSKKVRLVLGGNQSGKTNCGAAEAHWLSQGMHPYNKTMKTPNKGRIVATDLDKGIGEVVYPKYEALLPKSEVEYTHKYSGGQIKKVKYRNGSTVEFLSYEQDPKVFEGWTGDWVWFDEPPPKDIFVACYRGLMRNNGIIFITATPLSEPWLYDEVYLKAGAGADDPGVFSLPTLGNPYLSEAEIESFRKNIPEQEQDARLLGKFKHLSGLVYKEYGDVHRIPRFKIPKDWSRYMVQDFHQRKACAILWCAVDPKGTLYFYDELKIDRTLFEIGEAVMTKEKLECGRPVPVRWIDSISATPDRATGKSALKEFRQIGEKLKWNLAFRSSTKNHAAGFAAVHSYLQVKNGAPGMYFFDDMPHAHFAMSHYQWDDYAGTNEKVKESEACHFADCIRYICVMKPRYVRTDIRDMVWEQNLGSGQTTGYHGG